MVTPTPSQIQIRDHAARDLLVVAPAGCGKTEALALRVQGLLQRGDVTFPQKILVVTFSNRARDNIRDRLRAHLGAGRLRDQVSVVNFHGLSARIFKAHANVVGLSPELLIPENDWVKDECNRKAFDYSLSMRVQNALRTAKLEARTDDEVTDFLAQRRETDALEIERDRVASGRLTYDDLPRVAELILANDIVAGLYRAHFGAVIVDEFQDLTPQQLRIVSRIGYRRTTFAGDLAQGIYGFTGARPTEVYASISEECSKTVTFAESHRSSPAVLAAVNALIPLTGGTRLTAADPDSWPGGGLFATARFSTAEAEAEWVTDMARRLDAKAPGHRVGLMARTLGRRRFVEEALTKAGVEFMRWDDGVLDTDTARSMRTMLGQFNLTAYEESDDKIRFLREASDLESLGEASSRQSLVEALGWCFELLRNGVTPDEIRSRIKVGDNSTLVTLPGVHVLTGHVGKGQQFDWAMVLGAEDDTIPDFRARTPDEKAEEARVLSVMISRARHGVFVTHADEVPTNSGWRKPRELSPFFSRLATAQPLGGQLLSDWLRCVDWKEVTLR